MSWPAVCWKWTKRSVPLLLLPLSHENMTPNTAITRNSTWKYYIKIDYRKIINNTCETYLILISCSNVFWHRPCNERSMLSNIRHSEHLLAMTHHGPCSAFMPCHKKTRGSFALTKCPMKLCWSHAIVTRLLLLQVEVYINSFVLIHAQNSLTIWRHTSPQWWQYAQCSKHGSTA